MYNIKIHTCNIQVQVVCESKERITHVRVLCAINNNMIPHTLTTVLESKDAMRKCVL